MRERATVGAPSLRLWKTSISSEALPDNILNESRDEYQEWYHMKTSFNGYNIRVADADNTLEITGNDVSQQISVPPVSRITIEGEVCSSASSPARWDVAPMQSRTDAACVYTVPDAVNGDDIRLYHLDFEGSKHLVDSGEYEVDPVFGGLTLGDKWDKHEFVIDYELRLQRVDVLAEKDGEIKLFCGSESLVCPRWPRLPAGWQGITRIALRFADELSDDSIFEITDSAHSRLVNYPVLADPAAAMAAGMVPPPNTVNTTWTDVIKYDEYMLGSSETFARLGKRFNESKDFTLVYFGDSVTQGGDVLLEHRWTTRFDALLTQDYPEKNLTLVNSAVGGTNSDFGRERFERDVLAHKPDVVTIMFVLNDNGMDDEKAISNHRYFVDGLREINAEPVFITSNMNTRAWMPNLHHSNQRIIDFCAEENIVCLDAFHIWTDLPKYGIPCETLLANGINHPDNVAVGLFYELLIHALC
jgi:acyl-CoA thioesterase I